MFHMKHLRKNHFKNHPKSAKFDLNQLYFDFVRFFLLTFDFVRVYYVATVEKHRILKKHIGEQS